MQSKKSRKVALHWMPSTVMRKDHDDARGVVGAIRSARGFRRCGPARSRRTGLLLGLHVKVAVAGERRRSGVNTRIPCVGLSLETHRLVTEVHEPEATMAWRNPRKSMMKVMAAPKKKLRGATALPMM